MENPQPWPEIIMRSFFTAGASTATSEKPFYGSWNRLLNTMFPPDTLFEVVPQFPPITAREAVDFVGLLYTYANTTPVFVVGSNHPLTSNSPRSVERLTSSYDNASWILRLTWKSLFCMAHPPLALRLRSTSTISNPDAWTQQALLLLTLTC
jgi:hypothetical protein